MKWYWHDKGTMNSTREKGGLFKMITEIPAQVAVHWPKIRSYEEMRICTYL